MKEIDAWPKQQQLKAKPTQSGGQTGRAKWQRGKLNKKRVRKAKGAACWEWTSSLGPILRFTRRCPDSMQLSFLASNKTQDPLMSRSVSTVKNISFYKQQFKPQALSISFSFSFAPHSVNVDQS